MTTFWSQNFQGKFGVYLGYPILVAFPREMYIFTLAWSIIAVFEVPRCDHNEYFFFFVIAGPETCAPGCGTLFTASYRPIIFQWICSDWQASLQYAASRDLVALQGAHWIYKGWRLNSTAPSLLQAMKTVTFRVSMGVMFSCIKSSKKEGYTN